MGRKSLIFPITKVTKGNKLLAGASKLLPNAGKLTDLAKLTKKIPGKLGEIVKKIPLPNKVKSLVKGAVKYGVPVAVHGVNVAGFVGGVGAAQEYIKKGDYVNAALVIVSGSAGLGHTVKSVGKLGKGKVNGVGGKVKGGGGKNNKLSGVEDSKGGFERVKDKEKGVKSQGKGSVFEGVTKKKTSGDIKSNSDLNLTGKQKEILGKTAQAVKIGDETHTLSVRHVGGKPAIYLCSDCSPLLSKIDAGLNDPNLSDAVKLQLTGLLKRVKKFDVTLKQGKFSEEAIEQELQLFRRDLEEISDSTLPITNKFPGEALDPNGKIFGEVKVVNGKVTLDGRNVPREVDFVITTDKRLIIGRKHTTISNQADVLAAGNLSINGQGKIRSIDNKSGHFRPTVQESSRVPTLLREMGLDISGSNIKLFRFTINSNGMVESLTKVIDEYLK